MCYLRIAQILLVKVVKKLHSMMNFKIIQYNALILYVLV